MASARIATTRSQELQSLAASGQTAIESWRTLHTLLARELSPAHAALLAEPVANPARGEVDWYAEGTGPVSRLADLSATARDAAQARLDELVAEIAALAVRLGTSRSDGDRFLSEMLDLAMRLPGTDMVYVLARQPVLTGWGHVRVGVRVGDVVLTGTAARASAPVRILPPPASPYGVAPASRTWLPRTWLWGVLGACLLVPALMLLLAWRDPFGWFVVDAPQCRPGSTQLGLAQGLQEEQARAGVLRAELSRLAVDAGQRRLMCPPLPQGRSADADRAQRLGAQRGKLQVILAWDDRNDLDLWIACPDGSELSFRRPRACGGMLDVDANGSLAQRTSTPVENAFFTDPQPGRYRVIVDPYDMPERPATRFRLTIRREGQPDRVMTGTAQDGRRAQLVTEFTVDTP